MTNKSMEGLNITLNHMRMKQEFCDEVLCTEDGGQFYVHKIIMVASSPFFRDLFNDVAIVTGDGLMVPGVSSDMLNIIINYAYTREAAVDWHNVWDLMTAADRFAVSNLLDQCNDFLINNMKPENCIRIRKYALLHRLDDLEMLAYRYLMANVSKIDSDDRSLNELTAEEIIHILSNCTLNISEEGVWNIILNWINHDLLTRKSYVFELLNCVRLVFVCKDYLFEQIMFNEFVMKSEACRLFILEKFRFLTELPLITEREILSIPMARPRLPHDVLFLIGGCSGGVASNRISAYDSKADMWRQVTTTDVDDRRAYHQCAVIGTDIYIIGGRDEIECIRSCRCFNVVTKTWRDAASLSVARSSLSVAVLCGYIYAMSGSDGAQIHKTTEKYDPKADEWSPSATMYIKRVRACATSVGNYIFVAGGYSGEKYLKSMEGYDPNSNTWSAMCPMHQRRSELSFVAYRGHLYAVGGYNGVQVLQSAEKYDPLDDTWTFIPELLNPRCQFAMEVLNDTLIVVGGLRDEDNETRTVERYDFISHRWRHLGDTPSLCVASAPCAVSGLDDQLGDYVVLDRSLILEKKKLDLMSKKQNADSSYARALSIYNN